jgi:pimeloyl-ACP methyl ester carboxylesterase
MGDSDAPPYLPGRDETARVLLDSVDSAIGTEAFDLVGFSFGGAVAAIATGLAPERVRSLTLVGTAGFGGYDNDPPAVRLGRLVGEERIAAHRQNLANLMIADVVRIDALALAIQETNTSLSRRLNTAHDQDRVFLPGVVANYHGPFSAIWGERDQFGEGHIDTMIGLLRSVRPDVTVDVLPGVGHWLPYEAADAFNELLITRLTAP